MTHLSRKGFILFLVCGLALVMVVLLVSLNTHRSGSVVHLNRTIEQERIMLLAQAGINEMLARVKSQINDADSNVGRAIKQFWQAKNPPTKPRVIFSQEFSAENLKGSNSLAGQYLGNQGEVSGTINIVVSSAVKSPEPCYLGHIELIGKARYRRIPGEIRVKERREIKITDLSDPFLDKYALFVKSFYRLINNPEKRIIVQGIKGKKPTEYSFVYLGNRGYPRCLEFPQGHKSAQAPPVILDLDFREDNKLLGPFYQPASFKVKNNSFTQASVGNLFFVNPAFPFSAISGNFSTAADFHKTEELVSIYRSIVDSSSDHAETEGSLGYVVTKDYQKSGGNPANSEVFRSLVTSLMNNWQYHYGFTDYLSVSGGNGGKPFTSEHPFMGILKYFDDMQKFNPQRCIGGKMPALFGENRDTPVYIEGPVFLRFFKVAFVDQVEISFDLHGGYSLDVPFPPVPMNYEHQPETFSGKKLANPVDSRTDQLMSKPIEHFSINNFFFGAGALPAKTPTSVITGIEGHDIFPALDSSLKSVSQVYQTSKDFLADRIREVNGEKILFLDGTSLIMEAEDQILDLSRFNKFRGKGRIILAEGSCMLGDLLPSDPKNCSLRIYLMYGRFQLASKSNVTRISASLAATTSLSDNSSSNPAMEGGIDFNGHSLDLVGNLIVDNLFEMRNLPKNGFMKITHDPALFYPDYPVRVSVAPAKSLQAVNYYAE